MSTEATLFTLCSFDTAVQLDILDYSKDYYECDGNHEIITTFGYTYTKSGYEELCAMLGVTPYDVAHQEVTRIPRMVHLPDDPRTQIMVNTTASLISLGYRVWLMVSF